MMVYRWVTNALLVLAGVLASHAIAYAVTGTGSGVSGHVYTDPYLAIVAPLFLVGLLVTALRSAQRASPIGSLKLAHLVGIQVALFLSQEMFEAVSTGATVAETLIQPAVLLGLMLQPLVAKTIVGLVLMARKAGIFVCSRTSPSIRLNRVSSTSQPSSYSYSAVRLLKGNLRRGPPVPVV